MSDDERRDIQFLIDERDRRYQERFDAQEKAVKLALVSLRAELTMHIESAAEQLKVAYEGSERAIVKAEYATEKRFDAVNAFRAQQLDMINTLTPRSAYEAETSALEKRLVNLELDGRGMISRNEFEAYILRVEDSSSLSRRRAEDNLDANRRAAMAAYLAIGLAILGTITSVLLSVLPHTTR